MNLYFLKVFFCRNDVRIVIFGTVTGGILQILSKRYLKNHPELLENASESKKIIPRGDKKIIPRGGKILSGSAALAQAILAFLAEHGLTAGLVSSAGVVVSQIPLNAISTCLRHSVPSHLVKKEKRFIIIKGEKVHFDQCNENIMYLFNILGDELIPFEEKKKMAYSVLVKYLNLTTPSGRRNFVLCILLITEIFFKENRSSFYILMRNLIEAIREGKISKAMARFIVRRLRNENIPIDPDLADLISS